MHVAPVDHAAPTDESPSATARSNDGRHGLFVVLEDGIGEVAAGSEWVGLVRIGNTGVIVERVDLRVEGIPREWVSFDPEQVNLDQNQEVTVLMRIRPPHAADTAAGRRPYTVTVWSLTDPTARAELHAMLTVTRFAGGRIDVEPAEPVSSRSTVLTATVRNDGNTPMRATITTTAGPEVRTHPPSTGIDVPPGSTTEVSIRLTARRRVWTPPARRHPVQLAVSTPDGPLEQAGTTFVQRPIFPGWALKAVLIASAVIVLFGGLGVKHWLDVRLRPVPDVVSLPAAQAKAELDRAGFAEPRVTEAPNAAAAGTVFAQDPGAGSPFGGGQALSLSVSTGPAPAPVPNVQGLDLEEAKAALTAAGFKPVVDKPINDPTPKNHVAKQHPLPDTPTPSGAVVTLTPSLGTETVRVPDLRQKTRAEVDSTLQTLGLTLTVGSAATPANAEPGTAFTQTPAAGTMVPKGSSVVVSFAREATTTTTGAPRSDGGTRGGSDGGGAGGGGAAGGGSSASTVPLPAPPPR